MKRFVFHNVNRIPKHMSFKHSNNISKMYRNSFEMKKWYHKTPKNESLFDSNNQFDNGQDKRQEHIAQLNRGFGESMMLYVKMIVNFSLRIPEITWNGVKITANKTDEYFERPMVFFDWYSHTRSVVLHEVKHYWSGMKLLYADVRSASKMIGIILRGESLTRRQKIHLKQTIADIFRLVPMLIFVVVPLMEFLLPVALKLFPNMLPSQFEDQYSKEEQMKKKIHAQLNMAKFLQDTVEMIALNLKKTAENTDEKSDAQNLKEFIDDIRNGGYVKNSDIVKYSKLFRDNVTLDILPRLQLVAMCRFMNIPIYGSDAMLRYNIRSKLRQLKSDDRLIHWEGVNSLSTKELMHACQMRGMRTGLSKVDLRKQLQEWLELSLDHNVPATLLILSRALLFTQKEYSDLEAIKLAIGSLPDDAIEDVTSTSDEINKQKLKQLKRQEQLIEEEQGDRLLSAQEFDKEIEKFRNMVTTLSDESTYLTNEKRQLEGLIGDYRELIGGLQRDGEEKIPSGVFTLTQRIKSLIDDIGDKVHEADIKGNPLHILDLDKDGRVRVEEFQKVVGLLKEKPNEQTLKEVIERLDTDKDGYVSIQQIKVELEDAERRKEVRESSTEH